MDAYTAALYKPYLKSTRYITLAHDNSSLESVDEWLLYNVVCVSTGCQRHSTQAHHAQKGKDAGDTAVPGLSYHHG